MMHYIYVCDAVNILQYAGLPDASVPGILTPSVHQQQCRGVHHQIMIRRLLLAWCTWSALHSVRVWNISAANAIHHLQFILGAAFNNVQLGFVWTCLCTPYVILTPNIYRTIMLETRCGPYITCYCYFISGSALHQEKSMVAGQWPVVIMTPSCVRIPQGI